MHEISVMQSAMEIAIQHAQAQNAQKIHRVVMRIGTLAGVVPDSLMFAFDVVAQDTIAEGGTLEIETVQAVCQCADCLAEFEPKDFFYQCPQCSSIKVKLKHGKELDLAYLEVS